MNNDLISRAALLKEISTKTMMYDGSCIKKGIGVLLDKWEVLDRIQAAPAVDAEPVRHGRWIQSKTVPSYHSCSYCKRAHNMPKSCNVYVLPLYCPDCGAKMDGGNECSDG